MTQRLIGVLWAFISMLTPAFAQAPDEVTQLLNRVHTLIQSGKLAQAEELLEGAQRRFSDNPDVSFNLGTAYFFQHKWQEAIASYRKSLANRPNQIDVLFYLAQAYYQGSDQAHALETIAYAAKLAPDNPHICQTYGEYLASQNETREDGLKWLLKARALDPRMDRIDLEIGLIDLKLKDIHGAFVSFQAALKSDPKNGEAAYMLGDYWSAVGNWAKAQEYYNYAIAQGFASAPVYYGLGRTFVALTKGQAAVGPLKRALDLDPALTNAHFELSKAYLQIGQLQDSRREDALYEDMKAKGPDSVKALLNEGESLVHAGQLAQAQNFFENALVKIPSSPDLSFDLGMVFFLQKNWPKAIENYKKSLLAKPDQVDPLFYLAQAYYQTSQRDLAIKAIAHAAELAPQNPDVCQVYGEYLTDRMDRSNDGLKWLEKARSLNPDLPRIDFDIGMAQFDLNDLRSAAVALQTALNKDPASGEAAYYVGESYSGIGDWQNARRSYEIALASRYPDAAAADYGLGTALVELGSYEAAIEPLKEALELRPSLKKAHFQLGRVYRHLGRLEEAQNETRLYDILNRANGIADQFAEFQTATQTPTWAHVRTLLEEDKEQEALDYVEKLPKEVQSNAQSLNPNPYYFLGVVYHTMGRLGDAIRLLEIAHKQSPTNAQVLAYLGVVQLSLNEAGKAEDLCNSALEFDPTNELALIALSHIRYKQQRWKDVIAYLERSHTANPGALYMLCDAYFRIGKNDQALVTAEAIRSLGSKDKNLIADLDELVKLHQDEQPASAPK